MQISDSQTPPLSRQMANSLFPTSTTQYSTSPTRNTNTHRTPLQLQTQISQTSSPPKSSTSFVLMSTLYEQERVYK